MQKKLPIAWRDFLDGIIVNCAIPSTPHFVNALAYRANLGWHTLSPPPGMVKVTYLCWYWPP